MLNLGLRNIYLVEMLAFYYLKKIVNICTKIFQYQDLCCVISIWPPGQTRFCLLEFFWSGKGIAKIL